MTALIQDDAFPDSWYMAVRTTVTIDDELYEEALALADPGMEKSELFRESIKAFIRQQASRRLAALGGAIPDMS